MRGRLRTWWGSAQRHPGRVLGAVAALVLTIAATLVIGGGDNDVEVTLDESTTTSLVTTTTEQVTSTTSTTSSSTTTTAPPPTTTAPPETTTTSPPRLVFVLQGSPSGLAAMNPDGTGAHLVLDGTFRDPELAPNRSWLVMSQWFSGGFRLVTVNADGSGLNAIPGAWQSARISPDSTRIAAVELVEAIGPVLKIMNRDGTGQETIHLPDGLTNQVEWSPDGRKLLVTNSSWTGLCTYDLATGTQVAGRLGSSSPTRSSTASRSSTIVSGDTQLSVTALRPNTKSSTTASPPDDSPPNVETRT